MRARPQVCEALLFALALHTGVCYGIKWLALSKTPAALALNQTQHCKQLEGLVSAQVQLCRSNLELMHTIVHAAREVMKACRRAFSDMRWNCSSIELAPNYLLDLERGTRESAFVYALSAATISHAIARACTSGDLPGCSCGPVPGEPPGPGNRWGGCADNLSYGLLMGAKFSDAPMKVKKTGSQANKLMRLHNSEVGRQMENRALAGQGAGCRWHLLTSSLQPREAPFQRQRVRHKELRWLNPGHRAQWSPGLWGPRPRGVHVLTFLSHWSSSCKDSRMFTPPLDIWGN
ncbi:protein Wnt-11 isoform X2 [Eptesicus fuscus]|uniref:protein Wnt-11 isoform X2 n=1 Tax=Eptesicus fuscus TaxID=29078 RepID=UPI0024044E33|nr:protein Wnt-11 isoform X2 [Eptesicus fuscus]